MAFNLEYQTGATPDTVLASIRAGVGYWRESLVPKPMLRLGIHGVVAEVKPPHFRLYCAHRRWPPPAFYDLRGVVEARPDGGARVTARVGLGKGFSIVPWLLAALALWVAVSGDITGAIVVAVLAALIGGLYSNRDRAVTREDDFIARHLADLLDRAMAPLLVQPAGTDGQPVQ